MGGSEEEREASPHEAMRGVAEVDVCEGDSELEEESEGEGVGRS